MVRARRALSHDLLGFIDLEAGLLEVLDYPLGELPARIVGHVLLEQAAQQGTAARDGKADREYELVAKGAVVHWSALFLLCSRQRTPEAARAVNVGGARLIAHRGIQGVSIFG